MIEYDCNIYYKDLVFNVHFDESVNVKQVAVQLYRLDLSRSELSELCYALISYTTLSSFLNYLMISNVIKSYKLSANKIERIDETWLMN